MLAQLCKELSWYHGGPRSELLFVRFISIVFNYVGGEGWGCDHECRCLQRSEVLDPDGAETTDGWL